MKRRDFLLAGGLLLATPRSLLASTPAFSPVISASRLGKGEYRIGAWQRDHWAGAVDIAHRGHDSCVHPGRGEWLFFARRPGREIVVVDAKTGSLKQRLKAQDGYHYYGHGVLGSDGRYLFTTENHVTGDGRGAIGVYDSTQAYRFIKHLDAGGIGPHQLALMPDGNTLVVAVGGIKTLPAHGRETLNFDTMAPALNYLDIASGNVVESHPSPHPHLSLRHLDVGPGGTVMVGGQFQGELPAPLPLVYRHRRGDSLQAMAIGELPIFLDKSYVASISIDDQERFAVSTCPRDDTVCLWDLKTARLRTSFHLRDCAGATYDSRFQQFLLSNGQGKLMGLSANSGRLRQLSYAHGVHWDNHLRLAI